MNTFKKKSLYAALAGVSALGVTGAAQAVNVAPDGLGQVLLYPYYTTQANLRDGSVYGTLLSVVNSTASAKAVKVRFLEGKNSVEVLDFNLFLSPFDVWTAAVLPDIASGGAKVGTADLSCTLPSFYAGNATSPFVSFVNYAYTGLGDDGAGTGLDRTKEGYFEIIEMATYTASSVTGTAITHVNGVPPCGSKLTDAQATADAQPLGGGLFGGATLINVSAGTDYTEDAVALDNFYTIGSNYQPSGFVQPNLLQSNPPVSRVLYTNGNIYTSLWSAGTADPVSAVLMHNTVLNEYVLDTATKSGTDWVVTMPTKRYYMPAGKNAGNAAKLFQRNFNGTAGSCDDVTLSIYDREERTTSNPLNFSPPPPTPTSSICWEANVITFNNSNVLSSANQANVPAPFQNGWMNMGFPVNIVGATPGVHTLVNNATTVTLLSGGVQTPAAVTYVGLPVIGFALISYTDGVLQINPGQTVLSNYGGNFKHKNNTLIQ